MTRDYEIGINLAISEAFRKDNIKCDSDYLGLKVRYNEKEGYFQPIDDPAFAATPEADFMRDNESIEQGVLKSFWLEADEMYNLEVEEWDNNEGIAYVGISIEGHDDDADEVDRGLCDWMADFGAREYDDYGYPCW